MTSVTLVHVSAKCPYCAAEKHQYEVEREHAIEVVAAAMNAHIDAEHPEEAPDDSAGPAVLVPQPEDAAQ